MNVKWNKRIKLTSLMGCLFLTLYSTSCIKDEALNAEADIVACEVAGDILNREPLIENDKVTFMLKPGADITKIAPTFTLTPGATIDPASGVARDFTQPQIYTVTSEDGKWKKDYEVKAAFSGIITEYKFDNYRLNTKKQYYIFYETNSLGKEIMTWASGNEGFAFTGTKAKPDGYPTTIDPSGIDGTCLKLQTLETGSLGALLNMPIAAGNLFMGSFTVNIGNILKATKFGVPFTHIPTYVTGYYKYKAGKTFTVNGKPIKDRKDVCDIYGIFYETDDKLQTLDGSNMFTHPNLISIARIENPIETDEWVQFTLPFKPVGDKKIDMEKLKNEKYNIALVFSSSKDGNLFEGAVGSVLYIDEVKLGYVDEEGQEEEK